MCARSDWYLTMSQTFVGDQSDKLSLDHQKTSPEQLIRHPGQKRDDTEKVDSQIRANFTSE